MVVKGVVDAAMPLMWVADRDAFMSERSGSARLRRTAEDSEEDVSQWPANQLIDSIVTTHYAFVRPTLLAIAGYLAKLVEEHGRRHPELVRVAAYFAQVSDDLLQHMLKEQHVLFPYVRDLALGIETNGGSRSLCGSVVAPIRMLKRENRETADAMQIIRELTRGYKAPADGCPTYAICMAELARFERGLLRHVHLENDVLFPKAIELETRIYGLNRG
jgi:regulator of cell morphogenesis and NO signaling